MANVVSVTGYRDAWYGLFDLISMAKPYVLV
jgi:hypothetical protein